MFDYVLVKIITCLDESMNINKGNGSRLGFPHLIDRIGALLSVSGNIFYNCAS